MPVNPTPLLPTPLYEVSSHTNVDLANDVETCGTDITDLVKKELGIIATPLVPVTTPVGEKKK